MSNNALKAIFIFDMDGTLLDTRSAVQQAYEHAARELGYALPADYWGRSAAEWNCPTALHVRKQELYAAGYAAQHVQMGWAALAWRAVQHRQSTWTRVWTGASSESVTILRSLCPEFYTMLRDARTRMTVQEKRCALQGARIICPAAQIHYFDDDAQQANETAAGIQNVRIYTSLKETEILCEQELSF